MKISQRGPAESDISQLVHNEKSVAQKKAAELKSQQSGESTKVDISKEARDLQRVAELARAGEELRADKIRQIKEQVVAGEYHVESKDVAKSILRSEVVRLLKQ
jgi:negative regulator of flagellin synthesis FlgM